MQTAEQRDTMISKDQAMRDQTAIVKATKEACAAVCQELATGVEHRLLDGPDVPFDDLTPCEQGLVAMSVVGACDKITNAIRNLTIKPHEIVCNEIAKTIRNLTIEPEEPHAD